MAEELTFDPVTVDIDQQYEIFGDGLDDEKQGFTSVDEIVEYTSVILPVHSFISPSTK